MGKSQAEALASLIDACPAVAAIATIRRMGETDDYWLYVERPGHEGALHLDQVTPTLQWLVHRMAH